MNNKNVKFIFKELEKKDLCSEIHEMEFRSYKLVHHDEGGYIDNDIDFYVCKDKSLYIGEDGSGVYLCPEQVEHLRLVLKNMLEM